MSSRAAGYSAITADGPCYLLKRTAEIHPSEEYWNAAGMKTQRKSFLGPLCRESRRHGTKEAKSGEVRGQD